MRKPLICLLPMLVGGLIYVFWRDGSLQMFHWFKCLGIEEPVATIRATASGVTSFLPNWFLYSLPNALWMLSGLLAFDLIWNTRSSISKIVWISVFMFICIGSEVGQAFHLLPGVFDWQDINLMVIAAISSRLIVIADKQAGRRQEA